ncbi:unnamed protein product [Camellia sinensis]
MAYEQDIQEHTAQFESDRDVSLMQKLSSISAPTTASENVNGCFDCNICLDSAHEPVVTLCGHLYCWPCIYKWLHVQTSSSSSSESDEETKCPVCKANITQSSLVPLYGRGASSSESDAKRPQLDLVIPRRPSAHGVHTTNPNQQIHAYPFQPEPQPSHPQQYFHHHPHGNYSSMMSFFSPTVGMFGEMVFARMFGSSESLFSYPLMGNGSPRMRRQEMQFDKSLNRMSIFLFCCFILCLLLF